MRLCVEAPLLTSDPHGCKHVSCSIQHRLFWLALYDHSRKYFSCHVTCEVFLWGPVDRIQEANVIGLDMLPLYASVLDLSTLHRVLLPGDCIISLASS